MTQSVAIAIPSLCSLQRAFATKSRTPCTLGFVADARFCVIHLFDAFIIVDFNEILDYEIYENGSTVTFGGGGRFGIGSGLFGAETTGVCKDLRLIIRLKHYEKSQVVYDIISNTPLNSGIDKTNRIYKACIASLQEAASFFEVVKQENKDVA